MDSDTQLITAVEVLPGNLGALELVEESEANTGVSVQEAMGDAAYGDGGTRQAFADAGRKLVAWGICSILACPNYPAGGPRRK